jgi:hypothetical protein
VFDEMQYTCTIANSANVKREPVDGPAAHLSLPLSVGPMRSACMRSVHPTADAEGKAEVRTTSAPMFRDRQLPIRLDVEVHP